jgi:CrcB protein
VLLAVGVGAALGAWLRWALSYWLNPRMEYLPLGTLGANLIGAYLIGIAIGVFALHPALSPTLRLFVITGFLGGLTTFSTFSAESVTLLQASQWGAAVVHSAFHLGGSLFATFAGIATVRAIT